MEYIKSMGNYVQGKDVAIIAHITVIGLIIAIIMNSSNRSHFGSFHIRQALGLWVTYLLWGFLFVIPILGWIAGIILGFLLLAMWIVGIINAVNGYEKPMPVFGKNYADWFKSV